ncbi:indolepyruvate oxidoreductase subunit beta family protein [Pseudoteredinibacter isoporae]|uniref:Indolepyruvate ferredoxin oxidoreductase beta subunit n=1 Tax=Pseudoteredinibacter isoporae TaxID=570281 RepID=A0A7X0JV69_9GAMM|nr:indolepyruvate oxidoreductase subunit beta family protein [Pseudoteredinibacter isoporae]MBB6522010.1 indolepyruvate ferredoxin oxidoreductase beta subunit [Pseudoteredinibacter isoporae]NHO87546.1 indolepyruvate oxidoreductase subunit beta family protein [Pseudoteredinibacter isoporae]NIB24123.1 indolepyruvate oxidoreductase subunit beta family protein [Pseudoteredinibacter isoporae]
MSEQAVKPITIAISAMGGQGGGVLSNWIRDLAESNGYVAQSTSVPGVAQRTGATIYYLELFSQAAMAQSDQEPVLAMTPVPGDVDVLIAAELVEAGRALQRGFVSADRTTLIATTHRSYTVSERQQKGNGLVDSDKIVAIAEQQAKRLIAFDMNQVAIENHSVISSALFGALAASEALPFSKAQFESAIEAGGVAVASSLAAFNAAYEKGQAEKPEAVSEPDDGSVFSELPEQARTDSARRLLQRVRDEIPEGSQTLVFEAVKQLVDYQDPEYAHQYLDRLNRVVKQDSEAQSFALGHELAKQLALWMAFQDTIRVAEQKIRADRFEKIRREVKASDEQMVYPVEFLHPRVEEICDSMPKSLGEWALNNRFARGCISALFSHGRKLQSAKLSGFLQLYMLASMKSGRRKTLRYFHENNHIEAWLGRIEKAVTRDYDSALEIAKCQNLIKGYSDTHARGYENFNAIMAEVDAWLVSSENSCAARIAKLHKAALTGEDRSAFEAELALAS